MVKNVVLKLVLAVGLVIAGASTVSAQGLVPPPKKEQTKPSKPSTANQRGKTSSSGKVKDLKEAFNKGDYKKCFELANQLKEHAAAQNYLAIMYADGLGMAQDYAEAARWFRKAAEQGDETGQCGLGRMYATGQGVAQDYAEAARWYRKSAEQGNAAAQWSLGLLYTYGEGVAQDYAEAARWFRKSAEQGHADAQYDLGVIYHNGQGVAQDYAEAVRWFRKSAEQGNADAIKVLKDMGEW
ncbi:MAG: sel1 repeat family protein [Paramuribaculum sp.]|nr:sel1 repeat family protein [Paramuribaculum sp.]